MWSLEVHHNAVVCSLDGQHPELTNGLMGADTHTIPKLYEHKRGQIILRRPIASPSTDITREVLLILYQLNN